MKDREVSKLDKYGMDLSIEPEPPPEEEEGALLAVFDTERMERQLRKRREQRELRLKKRKSWLNNVRVRSKELNRSILPAKFRTSRGDLKEVSVFVDNGCQVFAMFSDKLVEKLGITTQRAKKPVNLYDVSGRLIERVVEEVSVEMRLGGLTTQIRGLISRRSKIDVVLGLPFLRKHSPEVDWRSMEWSFRGGVGESQVRQPCSDDEHPIPDEGDGARILMDTLGEHSVAGAEGPSCEGGPSWFHLGVEVELMDAESFMECVEREDLTIGQIMLRPNTTQESEEVQGRQVGAEARGVNAVLNKKDYEKSSIALDERGVPVKYAEFKDVFFRPKTTDIPKLPPHREYDLQINLEDDAKTPSPGKIYSLSPKETDALEEYLEYALARGWIRHSESPFGAPCFYVPKPNGGLRLCIDYRKLNAITKKNTYPLPLIGNMLDQLGKAKIFSRLDV